MGVLSKWRYLSVLRSLTQRTASLLIVRSNAWDGVCGMSVYVEGERM